MDEYSDFQMAAPPPLLPPPPLQKSGNFWGLSSQVKSNLNGGVGLPPLLLPQSSFPSKEERNGVGCRLANYNLGTAIPQEPFNIPRGSINNNLLIGDEDKYAALRELDFTDAHQSQEMSSATVAVDSNSQQSGMPLTVVEDDFSDFGDFQGFSNSLDNVPLPTKTNHDQKNNLSDMDASGLGSLNFGDFGDFVSVPALVEIEKINESRLPSLCGYNFPNTNKKKHIPKTIFDIPIHEFEQISIPSFTNSTASSILSAPVYEMDGDDYASKQTWKKVDEPIGNLQSSSSRDLEELDLYFNSKTLSKSINEKNIPLSDKFMALQENHSELNPSQSDISIIPPRSLKTSLIGCDLRLYNDLNNIESLRSASLMEANNDGTESSSSTDKNKLDISPETRSLASLDLGSYDFPEGKIPSTTEQSQPFRGMYGVSTNSPTFFSSENRDLFNCEIVQTDYASSDKYECLREDLNTETNAHILIWSKCLNVVKQIISDAVAVFCDSSSSEIIREVVTQEIGGNYIYCLAEVYRVFCRIKLSYQRIKPTKSIDQLVDELQNGWESFTSYFIGTPFLDILEGVELYEKSGALDRSCGICLNFIETNIGINYVELEKVLYHSGCANLWLNNVESSLPLANSRRESIPMAFL